MKKKTKRKTAHKHLKQIRIDNPNDIIENVYRMGNRSGGVRQISFAL